MTDRFLLPQADQPFECTVDTRIGTLDFDNQYPSKASVETILDNMTWDPDHPLPLDVAEESAGA